MLFGLVRSMYFLLFIVLVSVQYKKKEMGSNTKTNQGKIIPSTFFPESNWTMMHRAGLLAMVYFETVFPNLSVTMFCFKIVLHTLQLLV
jgi:hypothetical protein